MVQKVDKYFLLLVEETVEKQPEEDSIATNICIKTEVQEEHLNNIYRISITRNTDRRKAIHVFLFKYLYTWHSMNLKKSFPRSFKKIILNVHFKIHESRSTSNEQSFTCNYCLKIFRRKDSLIRWLCTITVERCTNAWIVNLCRRGTTYDQDAQQVLQMF